MNSKLIEKAEKVFGVGIRYSNDPIKPFDIEEHEARDRSFLAKLLVWAFLIGLGGILLLTPIYNYFVPETLQLDVLKLFTTFSGTVGPFVGVIAGYFFKK